MPADDSDLETAYSAQDYIDVSTSNDVRVGQTATEEFAIHQFKDYAGGSPQISVHWEGQTNQTPEESTVYLQIYNRDTSTWEIVDQMPTTFGSSRATFGDTVRRFGSVGANEDFVLEGIVTNGEDYEDASGVVCCRVYQKEILS